MSREGRSEPMTHGELAEDMERRRQMLRETEERIYALAVEAKDKRERGEPMSAVGETLRFLRTTIGHWEMIRHGIERQSLLLGTHKHNARKI